MTQVTLPAAIHGIQQTNSFVEHLVNTMICLMHAVRAAAAALTAPSWMKMYRDVFFNQFHEISY